jgi:hypothetical protein
MQATSSILRVNCYVRIKASGYVGKLGSIYRDEDTGRRSFGVDWASEYKGDELERISPAQYHASPTHLKITRENGYKASQAPEAQYQPQIVLDAITGALPKYVPDASTFEGDGDCDREERWVS